ncbi:MAG: c-type cytochrome [Gammaproteobacteria bacterium]
MLRSRLLPVTLATAVALAGSAWGADNTQQLLQSNGCTGCHAASMKAVGPAWGWIAYRYKGKKNAVNSVANFIINGGTGYWEPWTGGMPMPSHHNLSKAQAQTIAKWILTQPSMKPPKP